MKRSISKFFKHRGKAFYVISVIIFLAVVVLILEITNTTHFFHKESVPPVIPETSAPSTSPTTPNNPENTNKPEPSAKNGNTTGSTNGGAVDSNQTLIKPFGDFISNHHPGANSSPISEVSVCNTSPGATCYISFTQSATTTKLSAKQADNDGVATWSWDIKDAKLTSGEWKITAIATLNEQSKNTEDSLALVVK